MLCFISDIKFRDAYKKLYLKGWKLHLMQLLKYDGWATISSDNQQLLNHTYFFHYVKEMEKSRW